MNIPQHGEHAEKHVKVLNVMKGKQTTYVSKTWSFNDFSRELLSVKNQLASPLER